MKKVRGLLVGLLVMCATATGWAANHVTVESKSVAVSATGVQVGVFVQNDVPITAIVVPLELRSITPGTYVTTSFTFAPTANGRVQKSPLGPAYDNGADSVWPGANITARRYAVTGAPACSGPVSNTYSASVPQIDFVSPDAVFHAAVSTGNADAGELISLAPGTDPAGTANASFIFTFNVTAADGLFEIDTCCIRPANHLSYVDVNVATVATSFTKGVITVGNPQFPPVVSGIPDQTINEGQTFSTFDLDDYVVDPDDPDANITWTATGQIELDVHISATHVVTITTPDPDWFGTETVVFRGTDDNSNFDTDTATFTVNPVNDPPVLQNITNKTRLAGLFLTFNLMSTDNDNDCADIVLSMDNAPAGASLVNNGTCGATFNWTTVCTDSGVYFVTFIVSDGDLADSQVVQITIQPNPDKFGASPDSMAFYFAVGITDPAAQNLNVNDPGCGEMDFEVSVNQSWILVTPGTGTTSADLSVDIDTAGLVDGLYTGQITIRQTGVASPESLTIPVIVNATEQLCVCNCHGDTWFSCDSVINIQSVIVVINVALRGAIEFAEETCPVSYADANCDCFVDVLDVVRMIDYVFRNGQPLCNPCTDVADPCHPGSGG
jgi:hypothetical protein